MTMDKRKKNLIIGATIIIIFLATTRIIQPITDAELYGGTISDGKTMEFEYGKLIYLNTSCYFIHIVPISIYCSGPVIIAIDKWNGSDWEPFVFPPITICATPRFYIWQKTTYCLNDLLENFTGYRDFPIGYYRVSTWIAEEKYTHYFRVI